jgi:hypothetical protein
MPEIPCPQIVRSVRKLTRIARAIASSSVAPSFRACRYHAYASSPSEKKWPSLSVPMRTPATSIVGLGGIHVIESSGQLPP